MIPNECSLPDGPAADGRTDHARLLQLRWMSVLVMALIALLALPLLAPAQPVRPLLAITLLLAAFNLALHAGVAGRLPARGGALLQLSVDLVAWAAFLYFGGGVTNPAISLLLPIVAVGAAVLPAARAWALAALAVAIYSALWHYHEPVRLADADLAMHLHLAGMWLSFAFSAVTVVWFVSRMNAALRQRERDLAATRAERARDAYVVGLGKLAAGAAHRLGTPLGTLRILVDELGRRRDIPADGREDLALMREQIEHCKAILNSLTREAGQQRAEGGGTVAACDWLEAVVERWRSLRPRAQAVLACGDDVRTARLVADASLGEALHNLIDNAANAGIAAGRAGEAVEVTAARGVEGLVVEVADRGAGIPEDVLAVVRRGPLEARPAGMGVGLFLAHAAIEHHGGALAFRPRPGGGTIARFSLALQDDTR
ncbi:ATP-binding protein [Thauera sinica]|uniref:histidine kinase n=1 Tax=Thauera sinica TaxID=2665146 RepID=A0ABW1AUA3_9RHOO|nr:ATP-binding protein [Thauera sp. K11]ATE58593.1 two-component sensor histidine kinase [Thauera sp. K11]